MPAICHAHYCGGLQARARSSLPACLGSRELEKRYAVAKLLLHSIHTDSSLLCACRTSKLLTTVSGNRTGRESLLLRAFKLEHSTHNSKAARRSGMQVGSQLAVLSAQPSSVAYTTTCMPCMRSCKLSLCVHCCRRVALSSKPSSAGSLTASMLQSSQE